MQNLLKGVQQFKQSNYQSMQDLFAELAKGQHPETLFITCSDSRIDPNLITQTKPGDLFVIRNAGNMIPPYRAANGGETGTIEYAVAVLGVKNIIVCGHSACGAMKGVLHPEQLTELPAVSEWLCHAESTRRIVREHHCNLSGTELLNATIEANVLAQIENLRTHPVVASRLLRGDLCLYGWVYNIESGEVKIYDPSVKQFVTSETYQEVNV